MTDKQQAADNPESLYPAYARTYWSGLAEGKIVLTACDSCGLVLFPPTPYCPRCRSAAQSAKEMSGRGTVASWTTTHRAFGALGDIEVPYTTMLVELAEGPRLYGLLSGDAQDRARTQDDGQDQALGVGSTVRFSGVIQTGRVFCPQFTLGS